MTAEVALPNLPRDLYVFANIPRQVAAKGERTMSSAAGPSTTDPFPIGPLAGTRVVELGAWVAGPSAGGVLADWGADVIKVEPPSGDPMRRLFHVLAGHGEPASPPFDLDNRGKRSVVLDLRTPEGLAGIGRLVDGADVFLTNFRPDALARLHLSPDDVLPRNRRLIYASVTGYGLDGPDVERAGYDTGVFFARAGVAGVTLPEGREPGGFGAGLGDHVTGMTTVAGICAALVERARTGRGQLVSTSLLRTGIWCLGWDLGIQLRFGKHAPALPRTETMNPLMNPYRAADGRWFWLLGLEADRHWPGVVKAIERPELEHDERFADARARRKNARHVIETFDAIFATADRDEWARRFDALDVWWAPVQSLEEVVDDAQAIATGAFVDVPAGEGSAAHRAVATPVDFGGAPPRAAGPVPGLGEHNAELLG